MTAGRTDHPPHHDREPGVPGRPARALRVAAGERPGLPGADGVPGRAGRLAGLPLRRLPGAADRRPVPALAGRAGPGYPGAVPGSGARTHAAAHHLQHDLRWTTPRTGGCAGWWSKPFTRKAIARIGDRVGELAHGLLDRLEPAGQIDLREEFALPIPSTVINEMVGVPLADRDRFERGHAGPHLGHGRARPGRVAAGDERADRARPRADRAQAVRAGRGHPDRADPGRGRRRPASTTTSWWRWCSCWSPPATRPPTT